MRRITQITRLGLAVTLLSTLLLHPSWAQQQQDDWSYEPSPDAYQQQGYGSQNQISQGTPNRQQTTEAIDRYLAAREAPGLNSLSGTVAGILGSGPYTLGIGDVVQIMVRGQPEFSGSFVVGPDGALQYTFVGDVPAVGMTKNELKEVVVSHLTRYVKVPSVSVAIVGYNSKSVYLLGEVASPGKYAMAGDSITLREAVVRAGLPERASAATHRTWVITPDDTHPVARKIDLQKILYKGVLKENIDLKPGDVVYIPPTVMTSVTRTLDEFFSPFYRAAVVTSVAGDVFD
ncbi:MAG: polysaccharide export protein [Candidatus Omnitrophica bacterium]|nr:polysaccharide export protein [Candidatus Omnitrophota bacterium]